LSTIVAKKAGVTNQHPLIAAPKMSSLRRLFVAEFELGDVQRQIFSADFVETAHNAALDERPKAFERLRGDRADHILAARAIGKPLIARAVSAGAAFLEKSF
jgi:hypothetical protein